MSDELQQARQRFDDLLSEVKSLKAAHDAGRDVFEEMHAKAKEAVNVFNETAEKIAKKFNRPPRRITAANLLRNLHAKF